MDFNTDKVCVQNAVSFPYDADFSHGRTIVGLGQDLRESSVRNTCTAAHEIKGNLIRGNRIQLEFDPAGGGIFC